MKYEGPTPAIPIQPGSAPGTASLFATPTNEQYECVYADVNVQVPIHSVAPPGRPKSLRIRGPRHDAIRTGGGGLGPDASPRRQAPRPGLASSNRSARPGEPKRARALPLAEQPRKVRCGRRSRGCPIPGRPGPPGGGCAVAPEGCAGRIRLQRRGLAPSCTFNGSLTGDKLLFRGASPCSLPAALFCGIAGGGRRGFSRMGTSTWSSWDLPPPPAPARRCSTGRGDPEQVHGAGDAPTRGPGPAPGGSVPLPGARRAPRPRRDPATRPGGAASRAGRGSGTPIGRAGSVPSEGGGSVGGRRARTRRRQASVVPVVLVLARRSPVVADGAAVVVAPRWAANRLRG
jgi:hypothetical protein